MGEQLRDNYFIIVRTETVKIHAKAPNIARDYEVEGSLNTQKIKELSLKQQPVSDTSKT